jgi:hypothetical protein
MIRIWVLEILHPDGTWYPVESSQVWETTDSRQTKLEQTGRTVRLVPYVREVQP